MKPRQPILDGRWLLTLASLSLIFLLGACGDGSSTTGPDPAETVARSEICAEAIGGLAIYWDTSNGIFRPLNQMPSPKPGWVNFFHNLYPPLSFLHPPDWTPDPFGGNLTAGVNLIRNDRRAVWRFVGTWVDVAPGARAYRDAEVQTLLGFLGASGTPRVICANEATLSPAPGVIQSASHIAVEAGGSLVVVVTQLTAIDGLPGGQLHYTTVAAPSSEFNERVFDVFLPINFQLLYGKVGIQDSDGDGKPDPQDPFPFDPTR